MIMSIPLLHSFTTCFTAFTGVPSSCSNDTRSFNLWSTDTHSSTDQVSLEKYHHTTIKIVNSQPTFQPILPDILHYVGATPIVKLNKIPQLFDLPCEIVAKCEYFNPGGSIKDRVVERMISDAEKCGKIKPGDTLIEATSGNTGIGLALAGAVRGYNVIIVIPSTMSNEKGDIIRSLGATVVKTSPDEDFVQVAHSLAQSIPSSYLMEQFTNESNPQTHYETTAEEILQQCNGHIDMLVCAAGTGGTVTGISKRLKEQLPSCKIVCVDPVESNIADIKTSNHNDEKINASSHSPQQLEGIGGKCSPKVLDKNVIDHWIKVPDGESFIMSRLLIKKEGLLCGGSSGAILLGAVIAAKQFKVSSNARIVIILPDGIRNYMSKFMSDHWMKQQGYFNEHSSDSIDLSHLLECTSS